MYKQILKPLLFSIPPEKAHHLVFNLIRKSWKLPGVRSIAARLYQLNDPRLEREVFGIRFPNPVGLAAGLDKDARLFNELSGLGFGFIEIGTLTPLAQPGNPPPRLFRLPEDRALINRMGFNNQGAAAAAGRLKHKYPRVIIGGNIGKNKHTPNDEALNDYLNCFEALFEYVDYFVVNVSSPNTPSLRELQEKEPLKKLLQALQKKNRTRQPRKPILLKIAPDLNHEQLDDIIEIVQATELDGVIATNTTISREGLRTPAAKIQEIGNGGLSGLPLKERSTRVIRYLSENSRGAFPIIGSGGIHTAADALEKLEAGASLVQLYTGFIYEGPGLIKKINRAILENRINNEE